MIARVILEKSETKNLKPYACFSKDAQRNILIYSHGMRTEFQRDRDRIIHSKAFRRLEYKTQVYLSNKGDHLRTRLTHSLEVSQISRTIALQLGLNIDLVEAIALGHDVGHTPFGHAAERKLNELLVEDKIGYFKHNMQSVRIFKLLEKKYDYEGINLTIPVLEGILKHTGYYKEINDFYEELSLSQPFSYTLEGQVVAISDEIAQITHDMDDYLRYNILPIDDFLSHDIFSYMDEFLIETYGMKLEELMKPAENKELSNKNELKKEIAIRCLVDFLVTSLIRCSEKELNDDLRAYELDKVYIKYTPELNEVISNFHDYIDQKSFSEYRIMEMDKRGKEIITTLYKYYTNNPDRLLDNTKKAFYKRGKIAIADYISGMTDRFALEQYNSLINLI